MLELRSFGTTCTTYVYCLQYKHHFVHGFKLNIPNYATGLATIVPFAGHRCANQSDNTFPIYKHFSASALPFLCMISFLARPLSREIH